MGAGAGNRPPPPQFGLPPQGGGGDDATLPEGDPLAALMAMFPQQGLGGGGAGMPPGTIPPNLFGQPAAAPATSRTLLQRLVPLIHLVAGWLLLAYFVLWREPAVFEAQPFAEAGMQGGSAWRRWAELGWRRPEGTWGVQVVVRPDSCSLNTSFAHCRLLAATVLGVHDPRTRPPLLADIPRPRTSPPSSLATLLTRVCS